MERELRAATERAEAAERQLAERDLADKRKAIAKSLGLPDDVTHMVRGSTETEMKADAKTLFKYFGLKAPDTDAGKGANAPRGGSQASKQPLPKFGKSPITPWPANASAAKE